MIRWISPLLIAVVWTGCDTQPGSEGSESAERLKEPPSQEALVILAKADSVDGAEDKVISKCLSCSLGMDGSAEHTSMYGDYELHLCSATCKEHFDADPEHAVLAVKFPASPE